MNEVIIAFSISVLIAGLLIFVFVRPKKWYCNSKEKHEFYNWQDFDGPYKDVHYQCRKCKKCGYKEIKQTYIGIM